MRRTPVLAAIALVCLAKITFPQTSAKPPATTPSKTNCPADSARDTVQQLWDMAASGELVTRWAASLLFSEPGTRPTDGSIRVVSDYWWVEYFECSDESRQIVVVESHWGPTPGVIDSKLRFTPPPPSTAYQEGIGYRLVLVARTSSVPKTWVIEGPPSPPFATVTAAIRYVLEKRSESTDPEIKKNADETIAKLLKMH